MLRRPSALRLSALVLALTGLPAAGYAASAQQGGPGEDQPRFDIWEFQVAGNSVLDVRDIERAVYPHLGPDRTIDDVQAAQAALETLYRDAGYGTVLVTIPEQDVDQGVVQLQVTEGRIDRLMVSGSRYFSPDRVKSKVPSLAVGQVPELPEVQQELIALNRVTPDRRITPVLRPGRSPGTLEADLKVNDDLPVHGTMEVNDRYSRDTPRSRVGASLTYANLWQREHSATLGYQAAPGDTSAVQVWYGTYLMRLDDWLISGYYVDSESDVTTVGTTGVLGKGKLGGLRFIRPVTSLGRGIHTFTFGADFKDFDETTGVEGGMGDIETPIDYSVMNASYDLSFRDDDSSSRVTLGATFAPRILGNKQEKFDNKRAGSQANFAYLNLELAYLRDLWAGTRFRFAMNSQLADSPLISNEQFGIGGVDSVRGYLESEVFVDDGVYGQAEFYSPDVGKRLWEKLSARMLLFMDAGGGRLQDPLPDEDDSFFIWGTGVGIRMAWWQFSAALDWAYALEDADDGVVEAGDDRLYFDVRWAF